jgi:hypothetical protein
MIDITRYDRAKEAILITGEESGGLKTYQILGMLVMLADEMRVIATEINKIQAEKGESKS